MVGYSWSQHKATNFFALKVLGQPASSSCCERNWSTYGFIHSSGRNKLTPARASDLVYTHNNHRLLSRNSQAYQTRPSRMWDVGGDGVESFSGVGMLEAADLSLDEPELEEEIIDSLT
uniref:HAT C-terminal dimerisation domain-containing protein n=1 Tax=Aegilops tauschii subsp. strangulata TaxID=200361 RepID=A0A452XPT1_AEGTS